MSAPEPLLKTQQVAEALGVSVSTIKRWIDSGALGAARTLGKHRLVPLGEAVRFARAQDLPDARLLGLAGKPLRRVDDTVRDSLAGALRHGRSLEASSILERAYRGIGDVAKLGDELVGPVMERIGDDWKLGALDVFQEHRASRILESALAGLIAKVTRPFASGTPLAIGATPESDLYTLPGLLIELLLRDEGWDVANLGPNLPLASLANAAMTIRPRLIWLSIHHLADRAKFLSEYSKFYAEVSAAGVAVCLGGPALDTTIRSQIDADRICKTLADLTEFARRLASIPNDNPDQDAA